MDIPLPSVLLNADAVRAYLDSVHGPHIMLPQQGPPQEPYPQSPRQQLIPSKRVMDSSAKRMSAEDMKHYDTREASLVVVSDAQLSVPNMTPLCSSTSKSHTIEPRPLYTTLKRLASENGFATSSNSLKVFIPYLARASSLIERHYRSRA